MDELVQVTTACFCLFGMGLTPERAQRASPAARRCGVCACVSRVQRSTIKRAFQASQCSRAPQPTPTEDLR